MSIAIIIVNYNSGTWLKRSVGAALAHSDAVVYVVDNDSTDNSVAQTKNAFIDEPRVVWQLNQQNLGFAAANNQVLNKIVKAELNVEYAVLLNPDCELNEQTIKLIQKQFEQNPKLGLASCVIYNEDGSIQTTCRRRFPTPASALSRMLMMHKLFPNNPKFADFNYGQTPLPDNELETVEAISGAFMFVRSTALREVGALDEGYFMHCEDLDWCMRFSQAHWQVGVATKASVMHAKGVGSASRPIGVLWTLHQGMIRFFDRFYVEKYSLPLRLLVKIGIYCSFFVRASKSLLQSIFVKKASNDGSGE